MASMIVIDSDDKICLWDYDNGHSIHEAVDGLFETCSVFGALDSMCVVFCNESFLLREDLHFNALATLICNQPIYGNIVIMEDGYDDEGMRDALPFDLIRGTALSMVLEELKEHFAPIIKGFHSRFDNNRPDPKWNVVSFQTDDNLDI